MRRFISILLALMWLATSASAQIDTLWTRVLTDFGGEGYELTCATALPEGDFIVCGSLQMVHSYQDNIVMRINHHGETVWMHAYIHPDMENPWDVIVANDGTLRIFGTQYSPTAHTTNTYILALDIDGDSLWTSYIETSDSYGGHGAAKLSDGNFVIASDTLDQEFNSQPMLTKVDANGNHVWSRVYELGEYALGRKVIESDDGTLLLAGEIFSGDIGEYSIWLMRLDSDGDVLWIETWTIPAAFGGETTSLAENQSGDIFITAIVQGIFWWPQSAVLKFNSEGELIWSDLTDGETSVELRGIVPQLDGDCYAVGLFMFDFSGYATPYIVEYNSEGTQTATWQNEMLDWGFNGICTASTGSYLAYGWASINLNVHRGFVASFGDPTALTGRVTHVVDNEPIEGVRVTLSTGASTHTDANGDYFITSPMDTVDITVSSACVSPLFVEGVVLNSGEVNTRNFEVGIPEYQREPSSVNLAVRYDIEVSETVSIRNPGSGVLDFSAEVLATSPDYDWLTVSPTGESVPAGHSTHITLTIQADSEQSSETNYFAMVRIRSHSCPDSVDDIPVSAIALGVGDQPGTIVSEYALHPAYPNPFNAATRLNFDLVLPGFVSFDLFDIQGRNTETIDADYYQAGSYSILLDMTDQPSGVYFVRMRCNDFNDSQKIILLK